MVREVTNGEIGDGILTGRGKSTGSRWFYEFILPKELVNHRSKCNHGS